MGLFNRGVLEQAAKSAAGLLKGMDPPAHISRDQWGVIQGKHATGLQDLIDAMGYGGTSSNWEHGGMAGVDDALKTNTSMSPTNVGITKSKDPTRALMYHSHPHNVESDQGEIFGAGLSFGDTKAILDRYAIGVSSLDPEGGFGLQLANSKAPFIKRVTWDELQNTAVGATKGLVPPRRWVRRGVADPTFSNPTPQSEDMTEVLAGTLGLQRALKRANVLTHDESLPANEAQIAARAMLEPAVEMSAQAAQEVVSGWLKMNGYDTGTIKAIIAALVSSGGLMAAVSEIENMEADV